MLATKASNSVDQTSMSRTPKRNILVVEDENDLADLICFNLQREGFATRRVDSGDKAVGEIRRDPPDLIVLDRMLPVMSGDEVAQEVRRDPSTSTIPIIMITAKVEESDQLVGFALGADDYVAKPFSPKVLVARVTAMLRRGEAPTSDPEIMREGPFSLDWNRHELKVAGIAIGVTATEFRLMGTLMSGSGRVLDRGSLIDKVLGQGAVVLDRTIDVHITSLRKKLASADPASDHASWIHTVRGVGYCFRPPTGE